MYRDVQMYVTDDKSGTEWNYIIIFRTFYMQLRYDVRYLAAER